MTESRSDVLLLGEWTQDILGMMEMIHVMIMLEVTWMHTFVKTQWIMNLKQVLFGVCKIGFNQVEWKISELDCASARLYSPVSCVLSHSILCSPPHSLLATPTCHFSDMPRVLLLERLFICHDLCHRYHVPLFLLFLELYSNIIFLLRPSLKTLSKMSSSFLNPKHPSAFST